MGEFEDHVAGPDLDDPVAVRVLDDEREHDTTRLGDEGVVSCDHHEGEWVWPRRSGDRRGREEEAQ
jgi:hypothetical protein